MRKRRLSGCESIREKDVRNFCRYLDAIAPVIVSDSMSGARLAPNPSRTTSVGSLDTSIVMASVRTRYKADNTN